MKREEKAKKVGFFTRLKTNKELLVLSAPGAIWLLLFAYLPLFGILVAFKQYRLSGNFFESLISSKFVGLDNFKFLFSSGDAWIILRNTVLYNATFIILGVVLPVIVALLLNELRNKGMAKIYQSSMFLPYFLSWVVVSYCVYAFLNPEKGYFNAVLQQFGHDGISWYTEKGFWPFIIIFMSQWKGVGYNTVVYLASICGINKTYYEAAVLDELHKMAADKIHNPSPVKAGYHYFADYGCGRYFQGGFRTVLPASYEFRPSVSGDKCFGYLYFPGIADQRRNRYELCGGIIPVNRRLCPDYDCQ